MGEGAGIMILESAEHARARGAHAYGRVAGFAATSDAYHITQPHGEGMARAIRLSLKEADLSPGDIGYINAHGTSTPLNDYWETWAIKEAFGVHAYRIPVSSTKSMTGHLLGAAGAVEAIATILAMNEGILPPTMNLEHQDPMCDLDYIPLRSRRGRVEAAMSLSLGFGGHNAAVIFASI
ncbi:hypothetical protein DNHGIG_24310 [Collibacillus ludicampi]|uniref:Ketosynthase family 3 (KS3) domain-containing protein n=2 Tax=Collibacillus ludicampi TaxID=2771369 RepID=A0AAV4LGF0_9BACL|nr:hypothetical protein DNHGIG_24310 [Collibacillus ludicampi]